MVIADAALAFLEFTVCVPSLRVADPDFNMESTLRLARRASGHHAALVLFPELGLSAYTSEDLFHQDALLEAVRFALYKFIDESSNLSSLLIVASLLSHPSLPRKVFSSIQATFSRATSSGSR